MKEVTINKNDADQRLDKFLTKYLINLPFTRTQFLRSDL